MYNLYQKCIPMDSKNSSACQHPCINPPHILDCCMFYHSCDSIQPDTSHCTVLCWEYDRIPLDRLLQLCTKHCLRVGKNHSCKQYMWRYQYSWDKVPNMPGICHYMSTSGEDIRPSTVLDIVHYYWRITHIIDHWYRSDTDSDMFCINP